MQTSGPIRKDVDFRHDNDYGEVVPYRGCLYETTLDGKKCLLKTARDGDANSSFLLRREYEISCNLQHPNVLTPLKYATDTPVGPAIVMEYVEGVTLTDFLSTHPSKSVRKRLLSEILEAVEYLHKKGLLHNDLKTDNIIVSTIGNHIRIIDFGYSETDAQYMTKRLGGTAEASAPEVLEGNTDIPSTSTSDIYSLGGIIDAVFPNRYVGIVRKCHRTEPTGRYRDVDALWRAIRTVDGLRKGLLILVVLMVVLYVAVTVFVEQRRTYEEKSVAFEQRLDSVLNKMMADTASAPKIVTITTPVYITPDPVVESGQSKTQTTSEETKPISRPQVEKLQPVDVPQMKVEADPGIEAKLAYLERVVEDMQNESSEVGKIEKDIEQMYLATKDSLENPAISPYLNFDWSIVQNWIKCI